ncbi:MAG: hypothetical protein F4Z31_01710 [Gemmatimonadetes bacterium]|nr:hypothetical protein [Gemmatimonadota bacterium]
MTDPSAPSGPPRPPPPRRKLLERYGDTSAATPHSDKPTVTPETGRRQAAQHGTRLNVRMPESVLRRVEESLGDIHRRGLVVDALDRFGQELADRSLDFMGATDGGPTRTWSIRISPNIRRNLDRIAHCRGWTVSETVRTLIALELERRSQ